MSMQSFEFEESTIHESTVLDNNRPSSGNARARRKEEKRNKINGSPYGVSMVNPRQAWLNSMYEGGGFNNVSSSGYGNKDQATIPLKPRAKPVHRASHLDKEDMYDDIQRLKAVIAAFTKEKALRQTHIAKLEKELGKKDKLLEETYSQSQSTYGPVSERSYGSTSIETNSTITGLRQKIHKYECLLRDKENAIKTMKSDLKTTRLQELEIMCDTYYQEITRLTHVMEQRDPVTPRVVTHVMEQRDPVTPRVVTPRASTPIHGAEREKILEAKLQKLEVDNATLKKQVLKTNTRTVGDNTGLISEYASMSRAQLEEQHQLKTKELFDANLTLEELKTCSAVAEETVTQLTSKQTKHTENMEKLTEDRGNLEQKLSSVEGEHQAQKLVIRRLNKTVRQHEDEIEKLQKQIDKDQVMFRERLAQKTKIITSLEDEIQDQRERKLEEAPKVKKSEVKKTSSVRPKSPSKKLTKPSEESIFKPDEKHAEVKEKEDENGEKEKTESESETESETENETENKPIGRETKRKNLKVSEEKLRKEREEAAARKIQNTYRKHSLSSSVSVLQRVLRGHALRCRVAKEEYNQSAEIIQSALKGFSVKSQHIESLNKENMDISNSKNKKTSYLQKTISAKSKTESNTTKTVVQQHTTKKTVKVDETPLKSSNRRSETTPVSDRKTEKSAFVLDEKQTVNQLETSTDEDDLIMM